MHDAMLSMGWRLASTASLGMIGATQSKSLIQIITQVVAPGEWFVAPQQDNRAASSPIPAASGGFGHDRHGRHDGHGRRAPPPPVAQGGPADIQKANTIQFFPPALAIIVRAPSRIHTSITGGIIGGKPNVPMGRRASGTPRRRSSPRRNKKGNFKVGATSARTTIPRSPRSAPAGKTRRSPRVTAQGAGQGPRSDQGLERSLRQGRHRRRPGHRHGRLPLRDRATTLTSRSS